MGYLPEKAVIQTCSTQNPVFFGYVAAIIRLDALK
jgi:hypothetical protein